MMESLLPGSRFLVLAALLAAVAAAFALFIYGFVRTLSIVWQTLAEPQLSSKCGKCGKLRATARGACPAAA